MQGILFGDDHRPSEAETLLPNNENSMEMADVSPESTRGNNWDQVTGAETFYTDDRINAEASALDPVRTAESTVPINGAQQNTYRVYKMRWFGLGQLVLLNIVVSWDVSDP